MEKFTDILSLLSLMMSVITMVILLFYLWERKIRQKKEENPKVQLSLQRESVENEIIKLNDRLTSDSINFSDINHLFLQVPKNEIEVKNEVRDDSFFTNFGINIDDYKVIPHTVFCLMPFNRNYDNLYTNIRLICEDNDIECQRSDEVVEPGFILKQILELILQSQLILAVIDGRNPNVFYEIGIAHALGKTVILLAEDTKANKVYDISYNRMILYSSMLDLKKKLGNALKSIHYDD
jgi:hypothetical protein